jgi:hypothetical protein
MMKTVVRNRILLLVSLPTIPLFAWFGWMTYIKSKADWMQAKVANAMSQSLESLAPQWPRIETHSSAGLYFSPEISNPAQVFDFTRQTLEILNQDTSVPPLKLLNVSLEKDFGHIEDTLIGRTIVKFPLVAGLSYELTVQDSVKIQHYQNLN